MKHISTSSIQEEEKLYQNLIGLSRNTFRYLNKECLYFVSAYYNQAYYNLIYFYVYVEK